MKVGGTGIEIYMGKPGSGKSTMSAILARDHLKKGYTVYSNYPIHGCRELDINRDIMKYNIENALILIDEAGLEHDSRQFKSFSKELVIFYKTHRHYKLRIALFTQFWDDVDKKIRQLVNKIYIVTPTIFFWTICTKEVHVTINIDEITHQIVEHYNFVSPLAGGWNYRTKYHARRLFDSWAKIPLPEKDYWNTWNVTNKDSTK